MPLPSRSGGPLIDLLRAWRDKLPGVEVIEEAVVGQAGTRLADVARDVSLFVMGHKHRGCPLGALVGPVTHAVLRGADAPVAVVPHG
ncbi:universal stress protein [Streptomyces sp. NPDC005760]|uniref:universal stress protein n=1 Tax=Streptomyces sp. NPDC005760 TaxID=3156718 RepID=UPI00340620F3